MGFPLESIHRMLSLRRISSFAPRKDQDELLRLFSEQDARLTERINSLLRSQELLRRSMESIQSGRKQAPITGVPLKMLRLLACPVCGKNLVIQNASMDSRYIFEAEVNCRCGYTAPIRNGILLTPNRNQSLYDKPDTGRELYLDLPSATLSLFEKSYHWLENSLLSSGLSGRVLWESYVNAWFFLHNHLELLSDGTELIVTDKFPETLAAYKEIIEQKGGPLDILYIADAGVTPPLKKGCVDIAVDFFASNEHNFYHYDFWPDHMYPYLKKNAVLTGVYFYFDNGKRSMKNLLSEYPESSPDNFSLSFFTNSLKRNFRLTDRCDCECSLDSGENLGLGFHEKGDEMHLWAYRSEKKR